MKQETFDLITHVLRLYNIRYCGEVFKYFTDGIINGEKINYAVVHEQFTPCLKIWYGENNILMISLQLDFLSYYILTHREDYFIQDDWEEINLATALMIFDRNINEEHHLTLFLEEILIELI